MENYEYTRPPVKRNNSAKLKKLRRKNRSKSIWIGILVFIIVLLVGTMGVIFAKYYKKYYKDPTIEYVSMTEEASARAFVWLNKIEDTNLSYGEVKDCMGDIGIEVVKTPTGEKGVYTLSIADGTYENCVSLANVGLERAYKLAVEKRIKASGYENAISDELVEQLMRETFGMSVAEYLSQCEIEVLPSKEELSSKYTGEVRDEK